MTKTDNRRRRRHGRMNLPIPILIIPGVVHI